MWKWGEVQKTRFVLVLLVVPAIQFTSQLDQFPFSSVGFLFSFNHCLSLSFIWNSKFRQIKQMLFWGRRNIGNENENSDAHFLCLPFVFRSTLLHFIFIIPFCHFFFLNLLLFGFYHFISFVSEILLALLSFAVAPAFSFHRQHN